jgi:ATP phosphoribosyltransferase
MKTSAERLRIAIQKSGRLSEESFNLLERCGIQLKPRKDQLFCHSNNFPLDVLLVRDDDIPNLIANNICDFGIVGTNLLQELSLTESASYSTISKLDFGICRLSIAMPENFIYQDLQSLNNCTIATSYPNLLKNFIMENQINIKITTLSGSVEIAPRLGIADGICDLVSTGATLEANHLREIKTIFNSQAVLIKSEVELEPTRAKIAEIFLNRINGSQHANGSKYIMLHAAKSSLDKIVMLLPGAEHPSVMPLQGDPDRIAIHALCRENIFWETMEQLKIAGASSILVLPIEKMLF